MSQKKLDEQDRRPISPHLQIYRPQITSTLSVLHRITGLALVGGLILVTLLLAATVLGKVSFGIMQGLLNSFVGQFLVFALTFSLYYHLLNGIRHIWWDLGKSLTLRQVERSGWFVVLGACLLTVLTFLF